MDTPPFQITAKILTLVAKIQEILGELKSFVSVKPSVKLRKENKIKTIRFSLAIEGNSLSEKQITAILDNQRVLGPKKQITEVKNALLVYESLERINPLKQKDFLKAHAQLMQMLIENPGHYRGTSVGIFKGDQVTKFAPPAKHVAKLMGHLFDFLNYNKETHWLIKACVFHYELEFIHPFLDGNGRMGRLWQQLILMKQSSIFEYVSVESLIHKNQKKYYAALERSDKLCDSTPFVEFSLQIILESLQVFRDEFKPTRPTTTNRMDIALEFFKDQYFTRKEYLTLHKAISTATASRDLSTAVKNRIITAHGTQATAKYKKS